MSLISKRLSLFSLPNTYGPSLKLSRKVLPFKKGTWGFPGGLGVQGRDRRGQESWDGMMGKRGWICTVLHCKHWLLSSLWAGETWGRTTAMGMWCFLEHISSHQSGSQGAVCLRRWFIEFFFSHWEQVNPSTCACVVLRVWVQRVSLACLP